MTMKQFRLMFVYEGVSVVACIIFFGDGTFIDHKYKVRIGVTQDFVDNFYYLAYKKYIILFDALNNIDKSIVTERKLIDYISRKTDFVATFSVCYQYPYHKLSKRVFNNVLKSNNMVDLETLREEQ